MAIDFMDLASRYATARLDQATRPFTDPEGYMNDRMQQNYGVDIYGNTKPKSTTINYNDDGTQTVTQKTEVAPQEEQPAYMPTAMTMPQTPVETAPVVQTMPEAQPEPQVMQMPPPPVVGPGVQVAGPMVEPPPPAPDQSAAETQRLLAQNAAAAPVAPTPIATAPEVIAPPAPVSPYALAPQTAPAIGGLRMPPPAQPAPAPRIAPAAQAPMSIGAEPAPAPHYSDDFRNIYNKPNELAKYMGNETNPESGRKVAAELLKIQLNGTDAEGKANEVLTRMATGDTKATNQVMRDLRQDKSEGSYIKAILFARLGLNDLAKEEQEKLSTTGKMSRAILGDQTYAVVTNARGAITKAYDDNGDVVNDKTLAKLNAQGITQGTQAYGFTGEPGIITEPDGTKAEVRQRTNSVTGRVENVYATGPRANQVYTGTQIPQPKSVSTAMAKMDYGVITDLQKKHGSNVLDAMAGYEKIKGPMTPGERQDFMTLYGYGRTVSGGAVTQPEGAQPPAPVTKPVDQAAVIRADADIAALNREIARTKPTNKAEQVRLGVLNTELAQAQQRRQAATGGAISGLPGGTAGVSTPSVSTPSGNIQTPIGSLEQQQALGKRGAEVAQDINKRAAEERIQVAGKRSESFNKILDEEVRPNGQAGDTVSSVRKQQFAMFDRPGVDVNKIFGLYNAAAEGTGDQKLSILRDIFGGVFKPDAEVSQRLAQLNLTPQEKSVLMEYNTANQKINAATLKQTAGPGSVSEAEQKANREANVDPTKVPALGAFNAMAQSQFDGDRARYKADWALTSPATNALQLDKEWRKENQRLSEMYRGIATERAKFIAANGGTTTAVQQGYKRFPVPEYDAETGTWKKTRPLSSYQK